MMAPHKVYFDSMVARSRNHGVRAKVISKTTRKSQSGNQKYQRLLLLDEKGFTMKAVLFGHNVDYFDEILTENNCYDMSNLVISPVDPRFQSYPGEKQIHINTSCSIKKADTDAASPLFNTKLSKISDLPRDTPLCNATFDMIVVVLHVIPLRKVMNKRTNTESDLTEIYVTDDSCSEAILLSLWNSYAQSCEEFGRSDPCGSVVLFSGLKIKDFKGFSLSTTYYSKITFDPTGAGVVELKKWFADNRNGILAKTGIATLQKQHLPSDIPITTIKHAQEMKASDVTAEDVVKVAAYVPDFTMHSLRLAVSCNLCGLSCDVPPDVSYLCDKCQNYTFSTARMFFDFTPTDGTGTLKLATNSKTAEQLLKITSVELYKMTDKERASFVDKASTALRSEKTEMLLSPVPNFLTDHNKIVWRLKEIL